MNLGQFKILHIMAAEPLDDSGIWINRLNYLTIKAKTLKYLLPFSFLSLVEN